MKVKLSQILSAGAIALCLGLPLQAKTTYFAATLSGETESPANDSAGTGWSQVVYDDIAHTLMISITFAGLGTPSIAAHIHASATASLLTNAPVAIDTPYLPGFPLGVTGYDNYNTTLLLTDPANFTPQFVMANGGTAAGAEAAFIMYMKTNHAYANVHTTEFGGGEIRGFYVEVPDTATTLGLLSFALGLIGLVARRTRRAY